jgi:glucose/arabinose dehydrogenase
MNRNIVFAAALAAGYATSAAAQIPADLSLQPVITSGSVSGATGLRHAGDGSGRLFVLEQLGNLKIIRDGAVLSPPFLTLNASTPGGFTGSGESGLLGVAFHPQFVSNRKFYVNYTDGNGDTRIVEYQASSSNPDVADLTTRRQLMLITQPAWNHNGGNLLFGPDGYLYIGMGDGGGSGGSGAGLSQNLTTLLGKMLRIDVDGSAANAHACGGTGTLPYAIPADNPFAGGGGCAEIAYIGLRNPWRWSFDRVTGDLFIGDVGQNALEEVDFVAADQLNQVHNFGWKCFEGSNSYSGCGASMAYPHVLPIMQYPRSQGYSITGGYVYRGPIKGLRGTYIFGDYGSRKIFFANKNGSTWSFSEWGSAQSGGITSFGEDEEGNVYVVRSGGTSITRFTSSIVGPVFHTVTPTVIGDGGSLDPAVAQEVEEGDTVSFEVLADPHYVIDEVSGCDGTLSGTTFTTAPVEGDCEVIAVFMPDPDLIFYDGFEDSAP